MAAEYFGVSTQTRSLPFKWWLDSPRDGYVTKDNLLQLRGWVYSLEKVEIHIRTGKRTRTFPLNRARADVIRKFANESNLPSHNLGFYYEVTPKEADVEIGIEYCGTVYWVATIKKNVAKDVLRGEGNWLFLENDSNRSVDQFTGKSSLDSQVLEGWRRYLNHVRQAAVNAEVNWCLMIAPGKEEIFPDRYPFDRAPVIPIDQFMGEFGTEFDVVFPVQELTYYRELAYYQVDTHWSDFGAHIAASCILRRFGLAAEVENLLSSFRVATTYGDLGRKCSPPISGAKLIADYKQCETKKVYDNGISNTGKIWIFENPSASLNKCLIIFGGSSSINLSKLLGSVFKRVIFAHTVATWDQELVDVENPAYVLVQTNQRFLISAPTPERGVWAMANSKIEKFSDAEKIHIKTEHESNSIAGNEYYSEKMKSLLQGWPHRP